MLFSRHSATWAALASALAACAAYGNALSTPFVFDDHLYVLGEPAIRSLARLPEVLWRTTRPAAYATFALNYATGQTAPWDYKATNVLIHAGSVLLLFGVVRRTLRLPSVPERFGRESVALGLGVSLLWGVHPLATQAVTYAWQRCESLMALFALATLYAFVRSVTDAKRARIWGALAFLACLLGMGTKETMAGVPLLVLLYDRLFLASSLREALRRRWGRHLSLFLTWGFLAFLLLNSAGAYHDNPGVGFGSDGTTPGEYLLTELPVWTRYLRLALWPSPLVFDYAPPQAPGIGEGLLAGSPALLCLMVLLLLLFQASKWAFPGAVAFVILAPTSTLMPMPDPIVEHRMYLPLAALVALAVVGGYAILARIEWANSRRLRLAGFILLLGLAGVLATRTHARNAVYASERFLWEDTVRKAPRNHRAHANLGRALLLAGRPEAAVSHLWQALAICPANDDARVTLGAALAAQGRYDEALAQFREALKRQTTTPERAYFGMAAVYADIGESAKAEVCLHEALSASPEYVEAWNSLGVLHAQAGRNPEAKKAFREALRLEPGHRAARDNLKRLGE